MTIELKPGEYIATCRDCGAKGIEDATDPAPGLCPTCYKRRLNASLCELQKRIRESEKDNGN